jgi:hypothetical protein
LTFHLRTRLKHLEFASRLHGIETTMCPRQRLTRDGWKTTYCYPVTLKWIWAVKAEAFMGLLIP